MKNQPRGTSVLQIWARGHIYVCAYPHFTAPHSPLALVAFRSAAFILSQLIIT